MIKFKIGDRVVLAEEPIFSVSGDTDVGQIGTVLEESTAPWVLFDEPTRYRGAAIGVEGARKGYMDCIPQGYLELIEE